jgi:hypothetical protein
MQDETFHSADTDNCSAYKRMALLKNTIYITNTSLAFLQRATQSWKNEKLLVFLSQLVTCDTLCFLSSDFGLLASSKEQAKST